MHNGCPIWDVKKIAKYFNVPRNRIEKYIADVIIAPNRKKFPKWMGRNPDVSISEKGKLLFKCTQNNSNKGRVWESLEDAINYIE